MCPVQRLDLQAFYTIFLHNKQTQDISGWNNTQWGMTYEQVRELYPVGALQTNTNVGTAFANHASLQGYQLGNSRYTLEFHFSRNNELQSVILRWDQRGETPIRELLSALTARYGQARDVSVRQLDWGREWNLPSTRIFLGSPMSVDNGVTLAYRQQSIRGGV